MHFASDYNFDKLAAMRVNDGLKLSSSIDSILSGHFAR